MRIPKHMAVAASTLAFAGSAAFFTMAAAPASAASAASAAISATAQARGLGHGFGGFGREEEAQGPGEDFIVEEGDFFVNEEDGSNRGG
jgi:hypothetical protein